MTDKFQKMLDDKMSDFNWEIEGEKEKEKEKEKIKAEVKKKLPVVKVHRHKKGKEILRYEWERFINDLENWITKELRIDFAHIEEEDYQKYSQMLIEIYHENALPIDFDKYRPLFKEHMKVSKKEMFESEKMIDPELSGLVKSDIKKKKAIEKEKEDIEKFERMRTKWKKWNWKKKE